MKLETIINHDAKLLAMKIEHAIADRHATLDSHCVVDPGYIYTPYYESAMEQIRKLIRVKDALTSVNL